MKEFYRSDDYAGISTDNISFYYGYEHSICCECGKTNKGEHCDEHENADRHWCFVAKFGGKDFVIPFPELGPTDMFDVVQCLGHGIAMVLNNELKEHGLELVVKAKKVTK